MAQNFQPNGRVNGINYVNPNHPVNLNFVQGLNNPGHQMPTFQPQQQQMNQQPQQQQQQIQAPPPQQQQGKNNKRNRRMNVMDLNENNSRAGKNGKGVKERKGLSETKKRVNSNNARDDKINQSRHKRMTTNNSSTSKFKVVSDLQQNLQLLGVLQNEPKIIRSADALMGDLTGVVDEQNEGVAFFDEMGRSCPKNSMIIPSNSYQLPKVEIDKTTTKIRHIFIKFSTHWFNEAITETYRNNNVDDENQALLTEDEIFKKVKTVDIFNKISELTEEQIQIVKSHYDPSGLIYIIIASGDMVDSIIAAHCTLKKYPIIQINHEGQGEIMDIQDKVKRATRFAARVNEVARNYTNFTRIKKNKALVPNQMFCLGNKK